MNKEITLFVLYCIIIEHTAQPTEQRKIDDREQPEKGGLKQIRIDEQTEKDAQNMYRVGKQISNELRALENQKLKNPEEAVEFLLKMMKIVASGSCASYKLFLHRKYFSNWSILIFFFQPQMEKSIYLAT